MKITKKFYIVPFIAVLAVVGYLAANNDSGEALLPASRSEHVIELQEDGFNPEEITIRKGDTVIFTTTKGSYFWPASNLHPTHTFYPEFDPEEPIAPDERWSFRFEKPGVWKYHDHLAPYFTGVITVIEGEEIGPQSSCAGNLHTFNCWEDTLLATLDEDGLEKTFDVLAQLYSEEKEFPSSCHYLTHNIGIAAYKHYLNDKDSVLTPKASYCANGFYHGFMEAFFTANRNLEEAKEFCTYVGKTLAQKAPDAELQCYHGVGHGAIETSLASLRREKNEEEIIKPALQICEEISNAQDKLYRCASGVFNTIANFYTTGEFDLKVNTKDPLWLCDKQPKEYKESCYGNMNTILAWLSGEDFQKAARFVEQIPEEKQAISAIRYLSNIYTILLARDNHENAVSGCRAIKEYLHVPCIEGFAHGFLEQGIPGKEYVEALNFCRSPVLTVEERDICFKYALRLDGWYSISKTREICKTVEPEYQKYCSNL